MGDWMRTHRQQTGEERAHQGIALSATETRGTKRQRNTTDYNNPNNPNWTTVPCTICPTTSKHRHFHCMRDCFDGGLSHLSDEEKQMWIEMKRKKRKHNGNNNNASWMQRRTTSPPTEQANLAAEVKSLKHQLEVQQKTEEHLAALTAKAEEHGLEHDFEPIIKQTRLCLSSKE